MSSLKGEDDFKKLKNVGLKGNLQHCSRKLFAYGGREIDAFGWFKAENSVGDSKAVTSFVVVKCGRCILGNAPTKELQSRPKVVGKLELCLISPIPPNQCWKIWRFFQQKGEKSLDYKH